MKPFILPVLFLLAISLTAVAQGERTSTSRWIHQDGATELSVTVRNGVRFNDDYTDVSGISGDGSLEVFERQGSLTRRLKISGGTNGGELVRTYSVNGQTRVFDAEAKSWLAKMLSDAVGQGFEARARAAQILTRRGGVSALLAEIPRLKGDHTKRVYLDEAVKSGNLTGVALQESFRLAERQISSDHEKATFLVGTAGAPLGGRDALEAYFAAAGTVKSDYERGRVLKAVLKANPANKELLLLALASAAQMSSDYEKANVLIQAAKADIRDERLRGALLNTVRTITSDHERGRVLNVVYLGEVK